MEIFEFIALFPSKRIRKTPACRYLQKLLRQQWAKVGIHPYQWGIPVDPMSQLILLRTRDAIADAKAQTRRGRRLAGFE